MGMMVVVVVVVVMMMRVREMTYLAGENLGDDRHCC